MKRYHMCGILLQPLSQPLLLPLLQPVAIFDSKCIKKSLATA